MSLLMSAPLHGLYAGSSPQPASADGHIRVMCRSKQPVSAARSRLGCPAAMRVLGGGHAGLGVLGEDGECLVRTGPCLLKLTKTWPFSCFSPESPQKGSWQRDSHLPGAGAPSPPCRTWVSGLGSLSGHHADVPRPRSSPTGPCRRSQEGSEGHRQLFLWQDSGAIYQGDKL